MKSNALISLGIVTTILCHSYIAVADTLPAKGLVQRETDHCKIISCKNSVYTLLGSLGRV